MESSRSYLGRSAPRAVQLNDDLTRIGSTGIPRPSAVASCPLRVEETGSNVIHEYSAACSNTGCDGAEVSSGHSSCLQWAKGQGNRRRCPTILGNGLSQMFASAKLANRLTRVKPEARRQRETEPGGSETSSFRRCAEFCRCVPTSTIPTARCGPACRVVWEGSAR